MSIWEEIGISSKLLNGVPMFGLSSLSPCEAELHELMKQIDMMFQVKKQEWDLVVKNLEGDLEAKRKAIAAQQQQQVQLQASLQDRAKENALQQEQIASLVKEKSEVARRFDASVTELRNELQNVKNSYERLLRRHAKRERGSELQRDTELQRAVAVLRELETEYEAKLHRMKELENERSRLESEKAALETRVEQLSNSNSLATQRVAAHEANEQALRNRVTQLEGECERVVQENQRYKQEFDRVKAERSDLETLRQENSVLKSELERARTLAEQTNRKLTALCSRLDEAAAGRKRLAELEQRLLELDKQAERAVRERTEACTLLQERSVAFDELLQERETERAERDAALASLRQQLDAARAEAETQVKEREEKIAQLIRIAMQSASHDRKRPSCNVAVQASAHLPTAVNRSRVDENNNRNASMIKLRAPAAQFADDTTDTVACTNHELSTITVKDAGDADGEETEMTLTSISIDASMQHEHAREQRANSTIMPDWEANGNRSSNDTRNERERLRAAPSNETQTRAQDDASVAPVFDTVVETVDLQGASLIDRFVVEEQSRTAQLEALLDSHIEHLRLESEDSLQRFTLSTSSISQLNGSANASVRQSQTTG